ASVLPVWMLLCPRDYLSTFLKITTIVVLALAILVILPPLKMPALTPFARLGEGPVFAGKLFPFAFITIACGAISGFDALVAAAARVPELRAGAGRARGRCALGRRRDVPVVRRRELCAGRPDDHRSIVPLRDQVRGTVHPDDQGYRQARGAVHAVGDRGPGGA